jgi:hypothetical protein
MGVINVVTSQTGLVGVLPNQIYIETDNTYAQVTASGYLNASYKLGMSYSHGQMALVKTSDEGPVWLKVVVSGSDYTLTQLSSPGDVTLPTVANHLIVSSDTAGTLANKTGVAINAGGLQAGLDATAGVLTSYPATTASGTLNVAAVDSSADVAVTISNADHGQATVVSIPDAGAATASFDVSPSDSVAIAPKTIVRTITAGFAALATAGTVTVQAAPSATSQFSIVDIKVMYGAAGLSGGGGDRLLSLTDGTIAFNASGITAALLGTPIYTVWGGTGNPVPGSVSTTSTAGDDIVLQYAGGATDYTAGSVTIQVTLAQVTL